MSPDITNTGAMKDLVTQILNKTGSLDILINDAGNQYKSHVAEAEIEDFKRMLDIHLVGAFALTQVVLPHMRAKIKHYIYFVDDRICAIDLFDRLFCGKGWSHGTVRNFASEVSADGVRLNAIVPGWISTPCLRQEWEKTWISRRKYWPGCLLILLETPWISDGPKALAGFASKETRTLFWSLFIS